jgi:hypothetical protein
MEACRCDRDSVRAAPDPPKSSPDLTAWVAVLIDPNKLRTEDPR